MLLSEHTGLAGMGLSDTWMWDGWRKRSRENSILPFERVLFQSEGRHLCTADGNAPRALHTIKMSCWHVFQGDIHKFSLHTAQSPAVEVVSNWKFPCTGTPEEISLSLSVFSTCPVSLVWNSRAQNQKKHEIIQSFSESGKIVLCYVISNVLPMLTLNVPRNRDSITSHGSLFQNLYIITLRKFPWCPAFHFPFLI